MFCYLRRLLKRNLRVIFLLVLTGTQLLNIASGQKSGTSKTDKPSESKGSESKTGENKARGTYIGGGTPRTGVGTLVNVEVVAPPPTEADRQLTINLYPCKGEEPGNVMGISEQWKVPERVAAFVKKLQEPDPKTRACAARQLGYLGPEAKDAVPHLIKLAHEEKNSGVWNHAEEALWAIGPGRPQPTLKESKSSLAELVELSKAPDVYVRTYATFTLGYYKPIADQKVIVQALASAAKDQDGLVRWIALRGLARLGPIAQDAVPVLIETLKDEDKAMRSQATIVLARIGPNALEAVPALLYQLHHDKDYSLYYYAAIALGRIGPAILPLLEPEIKTDPFRVLDVLEHMGPGGASLVIEALRSPDEKVKKKAIKIVGWLGSPAAPAVPLLTDALKDQNKDISIAAANSLGHLGPLARPAVPALTAALKQKDWLTQCTAATALGEIGPAAKSAVPDLVRMMNSPEPDGNHVLRDCAAEGLMKMSSETRALVPADVIKSIEDGNARRWALSPLFEVDETRPKPKPKPKETPAEIH